MKLMREAGKVVAEAHAAAAALIRPGVTTRDIDAAVTAVFQKYQAEPLFLGFPGKVPFPAATCTSVNEEIVHGIPGPRVLLEGDIISVDTGCRINGWCADSAWTYAVGQISDEKRRLMNVGSDLLRLAIAGLAKYTSWSRCASDMEAAAKAAGFTLVRQFVGHAIGREMHEPPQVPNFLDVSDPENNFELRPGLVLAIEPMLNAGKPGMKVLRDHWTAVTEDGRPSVHFEHTIAMTADGPQLITGGVGGPEGLLGFSEL